MIAFIPRSDEECKRGDYDAEWLPRTCPACGQIAIIGHGRRWRPAHDEVHDRIRVRRGSCKSCDRTVTVLPAWCVPRARYTLGARQQAVARLAEGATAEQAAPYCRDPSRLPDGSTIRRWLRRRIESLERLLPGAKTHTTLLAWDWLACRRILIAEATPP